MSSPPPLPPARPPPLPSAVPRQTTIAAWQTRNALYHIAAALIHLLIAFYVQQWLTDDWKTHWGDQTFVDAVSLSFGGMLVFAFGKWLLMALLWLCLALGAVQFVVTAVVFRYATHRGTLMAFAWFSLLTPPVGTAAGLHALRHLKIMSKTPRMPIRPA